jgi:transcriptional regulator with XRE-family HTH domain
MNLKGEDFKRECLLSHDKNTGLKYKVEFKNGINENIFLQAQAILDNESFVNAGLDCICNSLSKSLLSLMKWVGISEVKLANKSEVSEKTIQRIRTGKRSNPSLLTMVALCIGLELPYDVCLSFIDKAGLCLRSNTPENMLYKFFLKDGCCFDIYQCDELLKAKDFKGFIKY